MKLALVVFALFAVTPCPAQQSDLLPSTPRYRVAEAPTISFKELQQRTQSKARDIFADAKTAAKGGNHVHAVKLFEKVLKIDPLFADARNDLAVELIMIGEVPYALDEFRHLIQVDPQFLMAYTNLGAMLCDQRKYAEAEDVLRRAVYIAPGSSKASLLLAIALYEQGKRGTETRNAIQFAARSNPLAVRLVKDWYGVADIADKTLPGDIPTGTMGIK